MIFSNKKNAHHKNPGPGHRPREVWMGLVDWIGESCTTCFFCLWTIPPKTRNDSLKETRHDFRSFICEKSGPSTPDISQFLHHICSIIRPSLRLWAKNIVWKIHCINLDFSMWSLCWSFHFNGWFGVWKIGELPEKWGIQSRKLTWNEKNNQWFGSKFSEFPHGPFLQVPPVSAKKWDSLLPPSRVLYSSNLPSNTHQEALMLALSRDKYPPEIKPVSPFRLESRKWRFPSS